MKKIFLPLLVLAVFVSALIALTSCNEIDDLKFELNEDGTGYVLKSSTTTSAELVIPDTFAGKPVVAIADYAFESPMSSLKFVTIPNSVKSIGKSAFSSCLDLLSVTIGSGVEDIAENAFFGCKKLVEVINKSTLEITAGSEEYGYIGYYAYAVHTAESKIVKNEGFYFATLGGENYLLGHESVLNYNGSENKELVFPESYQGENYKIYDYAFVNCTKIAKITLSDGITAIGDKAFGSCYYLTDLVIPDSVKSIGESAFSGCVGLVTVKVGNSVEVISERAFYDCTKLESIVLSKSITAVEDSAFDECDAFETVYYCGDESDWENIDMSMWGLGKLKDASLYYYSEKAPEAEGDFWHYDKDGKVVLW